jgi:uncharacterized protein YndB with AHSA1/START domain
MVKENKFVGDTTDREFKVSRLLNAPRDLVFKAWTDPKHVAKWWGPDGFTSTVVKMDVKPGGISRIIMHGPNGVDYPNKIVYTEVVKPERLVYMHGEDIDDDPNQFHTTITFEAIGDKTLLTMHAIFVSAEEFDKVVREYGAIEGNRQTIDRLEKLLAEMLGT